MNTGGYVGQTLKSRDGVREGTIMRELGPCRLEGCLGRRLSVQWPQDDGSRRYTYPCTKGLAATRTGFRLV